MDDKELVEVWRKQFQKLHKTNSVYGFEIRHGEYIDDDVEAHWKTFLLAKLSQPSVVLPKTEWKEVGNHSYQVINKWETLKSLTAAGIKYTIEE